jgi:hypothetical protein
MQQMALPHLTVFGKLLYIHAFFKQHLCMPFICSIPVGELVSGRQITVTRGLWDNDISPVSRLPERYNHATYCFKIVLKCLSNVALVDAQAKRKTYTIDGTACLLFVDHMF